MSRLRRRQLFEFNDAHWAPVALRELEVEALSRTLRWGHMLDGLVAPLCRMLDATGATEVLDLCSGAGGPAAVLAEAVAATGRTPPRFILSDLHPHPREWAALRERLPHAIDFVPESIDATCVPPELGQGRLRVIINALHHFPPELARQVLAGASEGAPGVLVAEGLERDPTGLLAIATFGLPALFATPALTHSRRLQKMALTWLTPVALAASMWDGAVSSLRAYTEEELREMAPSGRQWEFGTFDFAPRGRGTYFCTV